MLHELSGSHLIGAKWVWPTGTGSFQAKNPSTGEALDVTFAEGGAGDVELAAKAAKAAFEKTAELPAKWQADFLDAIAGKIMDLGDALLERGEKESALPKTRLSAERGRTVAQIKMFAAVVREGSWVEAVIDVADPMRKPSPRPDLRRMLRARGPVAIFGASNFPFAFGALGGDTASALAAGNPVIVKGHPSHPGTSELFAAAVLEATQERNLPKGIFNLIQGQSHELGAALVKHPAVEAVGFTGSQRAGRALFDLAAARPRPIPVYAEMGSLNPVVILPSAMNERGEQIARDLSASLLLGGGQFCTKPGVVFTIGDSGPIFVQVLAKQIAATASAGVTMLNNSLRDSFAKRAGEFAKVPGVQTVIEGKTGGHAGMTPALLATNAQTWLKEQRLHEEAFGPGGVVVECKDLDEAMACVKVIEGSLTGTVHTGQHESAAVLSRVLRGLENHVGRVIVNGYPTGVEVCHAIVHGGPYPATTDAGSTSVGTAAIRRFVRMVAYQDTPDALLPAALRNGNPLGITRTVNGERTSRAL